MFHDIIRFEFQLDGEKRDGAKSLEGVQADCLWEIQKSAVEQDG